MAKKPFLTDVKTLRKRARQHIEQGAVTPGYRAKRETVIKLLNEALATELVCVLRYRRHHFMASGIHATSVAQAIARPVKRGAFKGASDRKRFESQRKERTCFGAAVAGMALADRAGSSMPVRPSVCRCLE